MKNLNLKEMILERVEASFDSLFFAVPDLHGRADIANRVVSVLESLEAKNVVFLGDLIDRRPDPLGVVRAVVTGRRRNPSWKILLGNHEDMALESFAYGIGSDQENSIFNLCTPTEIAECCEVFFALPIFYETDYLIFTHGGICNSYRKNIEDIPREELLWSYGVHHSYRGKTIVRGHEIFDRPTEFKNNIATQTAAWYDNSPFCISIVVNDPRDKMLFGWIEIDLSETDQVKLVVRDSISEKR